MRRLLTRSVAWMERRLGNSRALAAAMGVTVVGLVLTLLTEGRPIALLLANGVAAVTLAIIYLVQRRSSRERREARQQLLRFYRATRKRKLNGGTGEKHKQ